MEAMKRWLTNAQVRIKSEVAYSNGMAAEIASHLSNLKRRVDACERPNIDKEVKNTGEALSIFETCLLRWEKNEIF